MAYSFPIEEETQTPVEPINLGPTPIPVPDQVYADRAARAHFALGPQSPGHQVLKDQFRSGQEDQVRSSAAAQADIDFRKQKLEKIDQITKQGAPVTDQDINTIMSVGTVPNSDPSTVIEDKFGANWMTAGVVGDPGKNLVFQSAFDKLPETTTELVAKGATVISRKLQAKQLLEEAQAAHDALPWFDNSVNEFKPGPGEQQTKFGNLAKNILSGGIAQYVNQRNLANSAPGQSILPGSNKLEQIQYLYLLPAKEFLPALKAAAGPGSEFWRTNPSDALDFIHAAVQYSTSDALVDNVFGVANVAGLLPLTSAVRGIRNLFRGERGVQSVDDAQKALKAAEEVLAGSAKPPKTPGDDAMRTAADVLAGSSKAPERGYYIPEAAVKRPWESKPRTGEIRVTNGVPTYFTDDGAEVVLSRTPQAGMVRVEPQAGVEKVTFRTGRGSVYEVNSDGTTTRNRAPGPGSPGGKDYPGGPQEPSQKTIYVSKKDQDQLGYISNVEGEKTSLIQDDKGRWASYIVSGPRAGKRLGNYVKASDVPEKGLYPVEIWDEGSRTHFGNKIVSVEKNTGAKVKFGPTIVDEEELQVRKAAADIAKSSAEEHPQDALSKMGQHKEAADVGAKEVLTRKQDQTAPINDVDAIRRSVPSFASPRLYFNNASSLSWRRSQELANEAEQSSLNLINKTLGTTMVERLPQQAFDEAVKIANDVIRNKYTRVSADAIRDQVTIWDPGSTLYRVETRITKPGGELFDSKAQAIHYKNLQYRLKDAAEVVQEGNKFYLSHVQHVDETQSNVRKALVLGNETPRMGSITQVVGALTGKAGFEVAKTVKSSAHTVSKFQMDQRVTATHSTSVLREAVSAEGEKIAALGKWTTRERQELEEMLIHNRDYVPPGGNAANDRGFFYKSAGEFETAFYGKFGKMPTEKQVVAYDSYTRISDLDWVLREFEDMKAKGRQGVRNYRFDYTDPETGAKAKTDYINGKEVKDFYPLSTSNANVYVLPERKFTTKYDLKDASEFSKYVNDKLKSGEYKIVQMYAPRKKPLADVTGIKDDIHFVVTNRFEDKAITFGENVPYRPGGHVIYEHENYLKQPNLGIGTNGRLTHFGDTTMKSFATKNETLFWAERYETARQFLLKGDEAGFQKYMAAGNLPETASEFKQMVAQGTVNMHPEAKFVHTLAGRDTLQSNEHLLINDELKGLKDTFSSYNMAQNAESAFLAERGQQLNTIAKAGTEANPIYQNVAAPLLDPYTSLQKGMGQIVRTRWMSDYKLQAAESWIQEFGQLFDQSKLPLDKLRQNPLYYLYHIDAVDRGVIKANPELYSAMMTSRDNILRFIGAQDETGSLVKGLELKVIQKIDSIGGQRIANTAEQHILPFIKEVPARMRAATFHLVNGMFNHVQLVQQGLAAAHAIAISPMNGMKGLTASSLVRMLGDFEDAATLSRMADIASNMGWKRDQFIEAVEAWKSTGVRNIGGEVTMLSHIEDPKLFGTVWGGILDKGKMFFNAGDRLGRDVSWFTAYHDWRDKNPTRLLDNRAKTEIASRYDTLNNNMTRASNAAYNEGILSVPSQFWAWNARLTENMLGKTLSIKEKATLAAYYTTMFGAPATISGATFGLASVASNAVGLQNYLPFLGYEDMRQYALSKGINVHDKFFSALTTGLPAMIINSIFGYDVDLQRFGPNSSQLRDIVEGKKEWTDVMLGSSGQMAGKLLTATAPFMMWAYDSFRQDSGYKIKANDVYNGLENWTAFNYWERAIVASNLGKFYAKNEQFNTEVDRFEAIMLGLGVTPQRVSDAYQLIDYQKHVKKTQDKLEKRMIEDWRHAVSAAHRGDTQTMVDYMTRVQVNAAAGNFTREQEKNIFKKASKNYESMVDSVNRRWLENSKEMQNIPAVKQWFENNKSAR